MKNFHTHTKYCKHAEGSVEEYVRMAKQKNITELGFSDHTPLPDSFMNDARMTQAELPEYVNDVLTAREDNQTIRILLGLECDYKEEYEEYYKEIVTKYPMDYLIGSVHQFLFQGTYEDCFDHKPLELEMLKVYADQYIKAMESSLFTFMAHPDLIFLRLTNWNKEAAAISVYLLEAAKDLSKPLEINCNGIYKSMHRGLTEIAYPRKEFWELAGIIGVKAIVNSDAHSPKNLLANLDAGYFIQKEYGIIPFSL